MTRIKGYFRKDGTFVPQHEDKRTAAEFYHAPRKEALPWWATGFEDEPVDPQGGKTKKLFYPNAIEHPQINHKGDAVQINEPSKATNDSTWANPNSIATFTPEGDAPKVLNGVPMKPWLNHPVDDEEWDAVEGQDYDLDDLLPPLGEGSNKGTAAGVVIEEEDGRVWIIHPTNAFGGYSATFPKGHDEPGMSLQATAIKEAFEESGLQVEITGFAMDVDRTTTVCRYYTAKRVGGTPAAMGWESQAVSLVPRHRLYEILNRSTDHPLAESLGAGPAPKPKWESEKTSGGWKNGVPKSLFSDLDDFPLPPPKKVAPKPPAEPEKPKGIIPTLLPPPKLQKPATPPPATPAPEEPKKKGAFGWIGDHLRGHWGWK
jgi:8-oxo-dGTP pyrophosphatase MutT (NUDIX family)